MQAGDPTGERFPVLISELDWSTRVMKMLNRQLWRNWALRRVFSTPISVWVLYWSYYALVSHLPGERRFHEMLCRNFGPHRANEAYMNEDNCHSYSAQKKGKPFIRRRKVCLQLQVHLKFWQSTFDVHYQGRNLAGKVNIYSQTATRRKWVIYQPPKELWQAFWL